MCQFNLLIVESKANLKDLSAIMIENGFGYRELEIKSLSDQIGDSNKIILTTKGHCDCGSILGIDQRVSNHKIDIEKEKKKLRNKKWSESKIDRHLSDRLKEQNKKRENFELGGEMEESRWIKMVENLLNKKIGFGILFHQFSGLIEEEEIQIEKTNQVSIELLRKGELRNLKENQLHWIKS